MYLTLPQTRGFLSGGLTISAAAKMTARAVAVARAIAERKATQKWGETRFVRPKSLSGLGQAKPPKIPPPLPRGVFVDWTNFKGGAKEKAEVIAALQALGPLPKGGYEHDSILKAHAELVKQKEKEKKEDEALKIKLAEEDAARIEAMKAGLKKAEDEAAIRAAKKLRITRDLPVSVPTPRSEGKILTSYTPSSFHATAWGKKYVAAKTGISYSRKYGWGQMVAKAAKAVTAAARQAENRRRTTAAGTAATPISLPPTPTTTQTATR